MVPELGGKYDLRNPSHKMLMSQLGAMSESEGQHVQARVRAAMDAQDVNEGRHQGGRAPRQGVSGKPAGRLLAWLIMSLGCVRTLRIRYFSAHGRGR